MVIYFLILTELMSFLLSFVLWSFQVLGKDSMDYGIRSGKSLRLGMPKAPQGNIQRTTKILSLGMPRKASPLSSSFIGNFTWSYIFIHHMICVLLGASCMIWVFVLRDVWIKYQDLKLLNVRESSHSCIIIRLLIDLHLYLSE